MNKVQLVEFNVKRLSRVRSIIFVLTVSLKILFQENIPKLLKTNDQVLIPLYAGENKTNEY